MIQSLAFSIAALIVSALTLAVMIWHVVVDSTSQRERKEEKEK